MSAVRWVDRDRIVVPREDGKILREKLIRTGQLNPSSEPGTSEVTPAQAEAVAKVHPDDYQARGVVVGRPPATGRSEWTVHLREQTVRSEDGQTALLTARTIEARPSLKMFECNSRVAVGDNVTVLVDVTGRKKVATIVFCERRR